MARISSLLSHRYSKASVATLRTRASPQIRFFPISLKPARKSSRSYICNILHMSVSIGATKSTTLTTGHSTESLFVNIHNIVHNQLAPQTKITLAMRANPPNGFPLPKTRPPVAVSQQLALVYSQTLALPSNDRLAKAILLFLLT